MSITAEVSPTRSGRPVLRLVAGGPGEDRLDGGARADAEALAVESLCLRRRAERDAAALEQGTIAPDRARVLDVVRAFRAYRSFVFDRDRELNDAAHLRLVAAFRAARA